jgi:hypothetical protein
MWFTLFYMAECTDHDSQFHIPDPTVKVTKLQISLVGSLFHPFHKHTTVMVRTFMYHIYNPQYYITHWHLNLTVKDHTSLCEHKPQECHIVLFVTSTYY